VLSLTGSETLTLTLDGQEESVQLLAGPYSVTLLDGWGLVRSLEGERESVAAELRSPNPMRVQIDEGASTSLTLRFRVDDDDIRLGDKPPDTQVGGGPTNEPGDDGLDGDGPSDIADPDDDGPSSEGPDGDGPGNVPATACASAAASCFDDLVDQTRTPDLPLCFRANQMETAVGLVSVCGDSQCASGATGCPVLADTSGSRSELGADGRVTLDAIAELNPFSVPVVIPVPIFGTVTCQVNVSGAVLASAEAEPEEDAGRVSGFGMIGIGTSLDDVVLTLGDGNVLCAALEPLLDDMRLTLEPQVSAALANALDDSLDELAGSRGCVRCAGACSVRCE
jgi:hypothetical protein